jgi:hypothetical protein
MNNKNLVPPWYLYGVLEYPVKLRFIKKATAAEWRINQQNELKTGKAPTSSKTNEKENHQVKACG